MAEKDDDENKNLAFTSLYLRRLLGKIPRNLPDTLARFLFSSSSFSAIFILSALFAAGHKRKKKEQGTRAKENSWRGVADILGKAKHF